MNVGAIILAGGKNRRMQQNKAFLRLGDKFFIERVIDELAPICQDIIISTNAPEEYGFLGYRTAADIIQQKGPLSGIHAGLTAANPDMNFVVPCDMPFLQGRLIAYMLQNSQGYDVAVPRYEGYFQPLHGVYNKSCIPVIEKTLEEGNTKVTSFYSQVRVKVFEQDELAAFGDLAKIFSNINTPDEFNTINSVKD